MDAVRRDIIARLERDILPLQGLKTLSTDNNINIGFRPIEQAFPNSTFPIGCTHEFLSASHNSAVSNKSAYQCVVKPAQLCVNALLLNEKTIKTKIGRYKKRYNNATEMGKK